MFHIRKQEIWPAAEVEGAEHRALSPGNGVVWGKDVGER